MNGVDRPDEGLERLTPQAPFVRIVVAPGDPASDGSGAQFALGRSGGFVHRSIRPYRTYPPELKSRLVQRYLAGNYSYSELAASEGLDPSTLRGWVRTSQAGVMRKHELESQPKSVDDRSPQEKLRLLFAARALPEDQLGAFLRREGLRDGDLERWEQDALGGLQGAVQGQANERKLQEAEKRALRSEQKLRAAEALLDLQKKVHELWGGADDDTARR